MEGAFQNGGKDYSERQMVKGEKSKNTDGVRGGKTDWIGIWA